MWVSSFCLNKELFYELRFLNLGYTYRGTNNTEYSDTNTDLSDQLPQINTVWFKGFPDPRDSEQEERSFTYKSQGFI